MTTVYLPGENYFWRRLTSSYAFALASSASCSLINLVATTPLSASLHEATSVKLIAIPNDSSTYHQLPSLLLDSMYGPNHTLSRIW